MKRLLVSSLCFALLAATARAAEPPSAQTLARPTDASAPLRSGIDMSLIEPSVRPQDDLSGYVNGRWFATTEIPADKPAYGAGSKIYDQTQVQLRDIVEKAQRERHASAGPAQRIGDLYKSFMDEARLETLDVKPLAAEFARIDALRGKHEIAAEIAHLGRIGVNTPYGLEVHQDNKDSTRYIVDLGQGGLGLPDRDYYLDDGDAKLSAARAKYGKHVGQMLAMAGDLNADRDAAAILALETELAKAQWTKVETARPDQDVQQVRARQARCAGARLRLEALHGPRRHHREGRLPDRRPAQLYHGLRDNPRPDAAAGMEDLFPLAAAERLCALPVPAVCRRQFRVLRYRAQRHAGNSRALETRRPARRPVDRRGPGQGLRRAILSAREQGAHGRAGRQSAGRLPAEHRRPRLDESATTKAKALEKLAKFTPKIGYPKTWRDYSTLRIVSTATWSAT